VSEFRCAICQDTGVEVRSGLVANAAYYGEPPVDEWEEPCPNCTPPDAPELDLETLDPALVEHWVQEANEAMDWEEERMAIRTEPLVDVAKDMMAYVHLVWEGRFELQQLEQQLASATENLVIAKARAEQAIIEAAGGEKALGSNEDARKRAMIIALADAPQATEYRELQGTVRRCEQAVAEKRIALENDLDQQTARRYIIRAAEVAGSRNGDGNN
jgi:hypothetical protein